MRKLALAASAACILLVNCTKRDLPAEENASNALSSISKMKTVMSGSNRSFLIISKQQSVSKQLIEKIKALGDVDHSLESNRCGGRNPHCESYLQVCSYC